MKYTIPLAALALVLAGCAGNASSSAQISVYEKQFALMPPTTEWLEQEEARLTKLVNTTPTEQDKAALAFIEKTLQDRRYHDFRSDEKLQLTSRVLTLNWGNTGRGGAALRQPAYVHTLAAPREKTDFAPKLSYTLGAGPVQTFPVGDTGTTNSGQGYSHYELSRWERFCNNGKGMDKRDWAFVRSEGIHNVPQSLLGRCNPPAKLK